MNTFRLTALLPALFLALALALDTASAQSTTPVHYTLDAASDYTQGCYPPCLCPILFNPDLTGSFDLQFTTADPAGYLHYNVLNVNLLIGGTNPMQLVGMGTYRHGGQVAIQEELVLDLSLNGGALEHYDSGLVTPAATFPDIDVSVAINGMVCYDQVPHIVAHVGNATGTPYCFGDGSGTACPCGNAGASGNGCASSVNASGASLAATGIASLANDGVILQSSSTSNSSVLFFQGTLRTNGGAEVVFGDGLRCATGTVRRLRTATPASGQAHIPGPSDPPLSVIGGITAPGAYDYQVWYRNAAAFCTPFTFNLTNGYEIQWTP